MYHAAFYDCKPVITFLYKTEHAIMQTDQVNFHFLFSAAWTPFLKSQCLQHPILESRERVWLDTHCLLSPEFHGYRSTLHISPRPITQNPEYPRLLPNMTHLSILLVNHYLYCCLI